MSTAWRALRIELLRGAAPVAAASTLVLGGLTLYSMAGDAWAGWAGRWMPFAASVRMSLYVVGALAVAAGAWQAGRERRRRIGELLGSTPRPTWQPFVVTWAAVTLGAFMGLLVIVLAGVALIAPVASYGGSGWWWVLLLAFPGLAALTALGVAAGRLVPLRLTAPVAAIGCYALMVGAVDSGRFGGVVFLAPTLSNYDAPGYLLPGEIGIQQALWFVGLTATALVFVGARRRWLAVLPAAVALAGAVPLLQQPPWSAWQPDPAALELVCTDDAPDVCLTRLNAFLLDDVTVPVRRELDRWDGVLGGPVRAVDDMVQYTGDGLAGDVLGVSVQGTASLTGGFTGPLPYGQGLASWNAPLSCAEGTRGRHLLVIDVAYAWGDPSATEPGRNESDVIQALDRLKGMPEADQKDWMGRYIAAAADCNDAALTSLATELS